MKQEHLGQKNRQQRNLGQKKYRPCDRSRFDAHHFSVQHLSVFLFSAFVALLVASRINGAADPPQTGRETEKRFPPLQVPAGFKATLFACDPLIEYPSAIALGPKPGSLFVAVDYMTGLGTEIVRRDEIRLIEDTDGDGYADNATVVASGFNSIEGMTFHDGVVYAMHAPLLTALRDMDGDGVADERRDLLTGLGLTPEENPVRLHCANGIVCGHDGWLYLALGDHGCDVLRPEGDRLVFNGGGILRCRTDGRDLHVFATGLRNIYDVALDDELNVFVRDNENDGGDYKIRVCHSFFGADHGYPYLYYERPDEALPPLADLGLGSSAGGVCYLETQFPPEYRGNLFFCEWGRAVMRYAPQRTGSGFAPLKEIEFAAGAQNDPYGFKPTDLVVDRDGSLLIADWCDGQRPKRGRARIYRIAPIAQPKADEPLECGDLSPLWIDFESDPGTDSSADSEIQSGDKSPHSKDVARLDAESYYERLDAQLAIEKMGRPGLDEVERALLEGQLGARGRMHAVWILARLGGVDREAKILSIARTDRDARVRVQAIRALADIYDPVLREHRLAIGPGDRRVAAGVAQLAAGSDPRVVREIAVALGRMRWPETPQWAEQHLPNDDPVIAHAVTQALRHSENWPAILGLIDKSPRESVRSVALRALADQAIPEVVDGLMERLRTEPNADRRREFADLLTRVFRKPGPWVYWGYRPLPRPANTVDWERTPQIKHAVNAVLLDTDRAVRLATLRRMQREKIPAILDSIEAWLADERDAERVAAILESLKEHRAALVRDMLSAIVRENEHAAANRLSALAQLVDGLDERSDNCLMELAGALEDGPILAAVLRQTGKRERLGAGPLLIRKLRSSGAEVRVAAADTLAELPAADGGEAIRPLLDDGDARVRRAAVLACGKLGVRAAAADILKLARDDDSAVRRASFDALRRLGDRRAVPLAVVALADSDVHLAALSYVAEFGGPDQAQAVAEMARRSPSADVLLTVARALTAWKNEPATSAAARSELDHTVSQLHGASGVIVRWSVNGPMPRTQAEALAERLVRSQSAGGNPGEPSVWQPVYGTGTDSRVSLATSEREATPKNDATATVWIASSEAAISHDTAVQFLASADGTMRVWVNGRPTYERATPGNFQADSDRFEGKLDGGSNRILVLFAANKGDAKFQLRFRPRSSTAEREQLVEAALARPGNVERGRKLFFDAEKSQCIKCHRLNDQGERIGPDLTSLGNRFSRIHIIESILEPSRTIAPSYESITVALKDGRILSGLRVAESDTTLTLADNQAAKHVLEKAAIEERRVHPISIMPDGLEKRFAMEEFVDLIAFLVSQIRAGAGSER